MSGLSSIFEQEANKRKNLVRGPEFSLFKISLIIEQFNKILLFFERLKTKVGTY
jgi:hypothetical protein